MRLRVLELRCRDDEAWARAHAALEEGGRAAVESRSLEELRVLRGDEGVLLAHLVGADETALDRAWRESLESGLEIEGLTVVRRREDDVLLVVRRQSTSVALDELDDDGRLRRFVDEVARSGTIWGLHGRTWARSPAAGVVEALPFWASPRDAARCMNGQWEGFVPRSIELDAFLEQWLTGMQEDGIVAVLLPTPDRPGAIVGAAELAAALRAAKG